MMPETKKIVLYVFLCCLLSCLVLWISTQHGATYTLMTFFAYVPLHFILFMIFRFNIVSPRKSIALIFFISIFFLLLTEIFVYADMAIVVGAGRYVP